MHVHVKVGGGEGRSRIVIMLARRERRTAAAAYAANVCVLDHQNRIVDLVIGCDQARGGENGRHAGAILFKAFLVLL